MYQTSQRYETREGFIKWCGKEEENGLIFSCCTNVISLICMYFSREYGPVPSYVLCSTSSSACLLRILFRYLLYNDINKERKKNNFLENIKERGMQMQYIGPYCEEHYVLWWHICVLSKQQQWQAGQSTFCSYIMVWRIFEKHNKQGNSKIYICM